MTVDFGVALKVLLIDDVPAARRISVRLLNKLGIANIKEADSVDQALASIEAEDYNLMVCDVHLKGRKGTEILEALGDSPKRNNLKSLFITSDIDRETFTEVVGHGASAYLLKPFSAESLEEKIKGLFGKN